MILDAWRYFEDTQRSCLTDIMRHSVPDREWELAQKPLASTVSCVGLAAATYVFPSAFIASWKLIEGLVITVVRHVANDDFRSEPLALPAALAFFSAQIVSAPSTLNPSSASSGVAGAHATVPKISQGTRNENQKLEEFLADMEELDEAEQNEAARPDHVLEQSTRMLEVSKAAKKVIIDSVKDAPARKKQYQALSIRTAKACIHRLTTGMSPSTAHTFGWRSPGTFFYRKCRTCRFASTTCISWTMLLSTPFFAPAMNGTGSTATSSMMSPVCSRKVMGAYARSRPTGLSPRERAQTSTL